MNPEECIKELLDFYTVPEFEGIVDTPKRVGRMYDELLSGYGECATDWIDKALFQTESRGMVVVQEIPVFSLCEHHLLPFYGTCAVGYIPQSGIVVGLSKISRVVSTFMHRLQVQERLTAQVADTLFKSELRPMGVIVVVRATHMCMVMRGARAGQACTTTSEVRGVFEHDGTARSEFFSLARV